jgi:hypothetical protein
MRLKITLGILAFTVAGLFLIRWYAYRAALRSERAYQAEMEQLNLDYERRIRGEIALLKAVRSERQDLAKATDRLFELLELSQVANNSREVDAWKRSPQSADRTAVALKWSEVAADEAAYMAKVYKLCVLDLDRGRMPHHITNDEVKPFRMPDGWTRDDWKWSHANRDE